MLRIGVDLVDIDRVRQLAASGGPAFVDQTWTESEQAYCAGSAMRLAARWGAKEAVMKALGAGFPDIEHLDIEVVSVRGEAPRLRLSGDAAEYAANLNLTEWSLSLSHEGGFALAFVVATDKRP
jgi:holo-[acyl-carrier protein] synthase